jgi:hypothetical protein
MDLSSLIKGIMAIIGIAVATGHYGDLERWARHQAIEALEWRQPLPYFFPSELAHKQTATPRSTSKIAKKPSKL